MSYSVTRTARPRFGRRRLNGLSDQPRSMTPAELLAYLDDQVAGYRERLDEREDLNVEAFNALVANANDMRAMLAELEAEADTASAEAAIRSHLDSWAHLEAHNALPSSAGGIPTWVWVLGGLGVAYGAYRLMASRQQDGLLNELMESGEIEDCGCGG